MWSVVKIKDSHWICIDGKGMTINFTDKLNGEIKAEDNAIKAMNYLNKWKF